jgi:hypothetical protein
MRRWSVLALSALVAAAALGVRAETPQAPAAGPPARSLEPPSDVLVAAGSAPDLILLYTGDVIGYLEPCG